MKAVELLSQLRDLDISIRLEGDQLLVDAPRNALTPELHERLTNSKAEILSFLRASAQAVAPEGPRIDRVPRDADLRLSHAQQRLWFLDQLEPGSAAYVMSNAVLLNGELDVRVLEACLTELVRRHEVLRTVFESRDGYPRLVIRAPASMRVDLVDLMHMPREARQQEARRLVDSDAREPFDLSVGPLFRCRVIRLESLVHVVIMGFHHIVFDAWSGAVFDRELGELYRAFSKGQPSPLTEPPLQYVDFANWQRRRLDEGGREEHLAYWKRQLAGELPALDLPADRPRMKEQAASGASCSTRLAVDLVDRLKRTAQSEGATLSMTLLAVFNLMLHRLAGQSDVLIGAPVAGRERAETEKMLGFFINTVVLRSAYEPATPFRQFLRQTRETLLGAYAHQDMPFEELVSALDPHRDLSRTPIFQVFFNHLHLGLQSFDLGGIRVEPFGQSAPRSKFDLTLYVEEKDAAVTLRFVYNPTLYDAERMSGMLEQFGALLLQAADDPDRDVGRFSLVTEGAKAVLPDPATPLPASTWRPSRTLDCAHIVDYGARAALGGADGVWTYALLGDRANDLARALVSQGIRRGDVVAVLARRDPLLTCALLGVLRAGAAFAILDPSYPDVRLAQSWHAAQPVALIRVGGAPEPGPKLASVMAESGIRCDLTLDEQWWTGRQSRLSTVALPAVQPDDLAYVAFTSGTTGGVKAIEGAHGPVAHFLDWQQTTFDLRADDRFAMLSGLSHDPLLRDVFAPLWAGAQLCIPSPETFSEPARLAEWLRGERITVAHVTPAMAQVVANALGAAPMPNLRYVFVGGDRLTVETLGELRRVAPNAVCVNFYGATETPQAMAFEIVGSDTAASSRTVVPLGRGIDGVQSLVLSEGAVLAGVGELGEIVIRTPFLAKGYRGDDALTRERFVANPSTGVASDRVYRTGDLGRYLPNGKVEFARRRDGQVKLRGFRIELGEIESALREHGAVAAAAATVLAAGSPAAHIVAYVVGTDRRAPDLTELSAHLRAQLPQHAVPSSIVVLDALPLTPNGKVDRQALPMPESKQSKGGQIGQPLTSLENQLLAIWKQVLGKEDLKATDNFFDVGGTSLTAVRLFSQLRMVFGKDLPLATLFRTPTVERLAALMVNEGRSAPWKSLVAIQPTGTRPPLFMVPGVGGNVLEFARLANLMGQAQPFYGTQSRGLDGREPPLRRIEDMASAYIEELRAIQPAGPYYLGGACMGGVVAFEMAQQLAGKGEDVALLALVDTPLTRAANRRRRAALYFLHPVVFLIQGIGRHLRALRGKGFGAWLSGAKVIVGIMHQMIRQRDVYRGDRSVAYQDLVTAANYEAMVNYTPREYPGRLHLFVAADRSADPTNRTRLDWANYAGGGFWVCRIKAKDSGELLKAPYVEHLADKLAEVLADVVRSSPNAD